MGGIVRGKTGHVLLYDKIGNFELIFRDIDGGAAEPYTSFGMRHHVPQELSDPSGNHGADKGALEIEPHGHDPPAIALSADTVGCRHGNIVEIKDAVLNVGEPHYLVDLFHRETRRAPLDHERREVTIASYLSGLSPVRA